MCISTCHAGHLLGDWRYTNFFCDCASRGRHACHAQIQTHAHAHASHAHTSLATLTSHLQHTSAAWYGVPPLYDHMQHLIARATHVMIYQHVHELAHQQQQQHAHDIHVQQDADSDDTSLMSGLLTACLSQLDTSTHITCAHPLITAITHYITQQSPMQLCIQPHERHHYARLVHILSRMDVTAASIETMMRVWLAVGSVLHVLDAVQHLITCASTTTHIAPSIHPFLTSYVTHQHHTHHRLIRQQRTTHVTQLASCARRVRLSMLTCDDATWHAPSMTLSHDMRHAYILSHHYGLVKLGTGYGETCVGQLYVQHAEMSIHAGGSVVCCGAYLLLRSAWMRHEQMMCIDADTLQVRAYVLDVMERDAG